MRHDVRPLRVPAAALVAGAALALVAVGPSASGATNTAPRFSKPIRLATYGGGEPSIAIDPADPRNVYVTAPQGVPAGASGLLGAPTGNGVGFWASHDGGKSFPVKAGIGSSSGGGDSDVEVGLDHTVYVADLEATAAAICVSRDEGKTFSAGNALASQDKCSGVTTNQQGPENDRQWLSRGRDGEIYLMYHDFSGGFPIIERSTDHGATFTPCGTILDPQGTAGRNYTPAGGTLVARPVVDSGGAVYVEVTEPDMTAPPVGAKLNHLYLAVADRGCSGQTVFRNTTVYTDPGADLGKIFNAVAVDGGGTVYVVAGGMTKAGQTTTNVWLFTSHDGGKTWAKPVRVNKPSLKANVMPAVVGGLGKNQVALSWFGTTTSGDPNGLKNEWRYYAATSFDGGKSFQQTTVTKSVIHYGDICTQGLFCGLVPGQPSNRNLADFASIAVDPKTGCAIIAFPGDPQNQGGHDDFTSYAYVTRQTGGRCLAKPKTGSSSEVVAVRPRTPGSGTSAPAVTSPGAATSTPAVPVPAGERTVRTRSVADRIAAGAPWLLAAGLFVGAVTALRHARR